MVRKKCSQPECNSFPRNGGACLKHGAKIKKCSEPECTRFAQQGGVCVKHGTKKKKCSPLECNSNALKGGVCVQHGQKVVIKKCSHPECKRNSCKGDVCWYHCARIKAKKRSNVQTQSLPSDRHPTKNLQLAQHGLICCPHDDKLPKLLMIVQGSTRLTRSFVLRPKEQWIVNHSILYIYEY